MSSCFFFLPTGSRDNLCWKREVSAEITYMYRGIGNSSHAPYNAIICPRAMRASANHTSEPVKSGGSGRPRQKEAFFPHSRHMLVHFYAFSVLFDSYIVGLTIFLSALLQCLHFNRIFGNNFFPVPLSSFHGYLCLSLLC